MMITRWSSGGLFLVALSFLGCGDSLPKPLVEDLVPVTGTVKLGGQPAGSILVSFTPSGSTKGNGATAVTDDSGKYELVHTASGKKGVPVGTYTVVFSKAVVGGEKAPTKAPIPGAGGAGGVDPIPEQWRIAAMAGPHNSVTVPEGGKTLDFDIPAN